MTQHSQDDELFLQALDAFEAGLPAPKGPQAQPAAPHPPLRASNTWGGPAAPGQQRGAHPPPPAAAAASTRSLHSGSAAPQPASHWSGGAPALQQYGAPPAAPPAWRPNPPPQQPPSQAQAQAQRQAPVQQQQQALQQQPAYKHQQAPGAAPGMRFPSPPLVQHAQPQQQQQLQAPWAAQPPKQAAGQMWHPSPPVQQQQQQQQQQHVRHPTPLQWRQHPHQQQQLTSGAGACAPAAGQQEQHPQQQLQQQQQNPQQQQQQQSGAGGGSSVDRLAATSAAAGQAPAEGAAAEPAADGAPKPKRRLLRQLFDYLLVMDLEATCDEDKSKQLTPQEIIELSCCLVDTATCKLVPAATFQRYVKPTEHPLLTDFCRSLTGITQQQVDAGLPLREALEQLQAWLREQGLIGQGKTFVPVTWRDWDLKVMMHMEAKWRKIELPKFLQRWVDLAAVYQKHAGSRGNLRSSVEHAGLQWEGRAHSALDDALNTGRLACKVMAGGVILGITGSFSGVDASGRLKQATLRLGGGKPSSGGSAASGGGGKPSGGTGGGGGAVQLGYGTGKPQAGKKHRTFDEAGKWLGICHCGVRAKKRTVKKPGPNNGKDFWSCGRYTQVTGAGCDFFKMASEVGEGPPPAKRQR